MLCSLKISLLHTKRETESDCGVVSSLALGDEKDPVGRCFVVSYLALLIKEALFLGGWWVWGRDGGCFLLFFVCERSMGHVGGRCGSNRRSHGGSYALWVWRV